VILGYVLFIAGFAVQTWAQAVNRYFEPGIRIQKDRGQTVIDTGPYAAVRHPGYISAVPFSLGIALVLAARMAIDCNRWHSQFYRSGAPDRNLAVGY
jgi:protein-S-isoprenylcysteine O-methyltransferase Ste14